MAECSIVDVGITQQDDITKDQEVGDFTTIEEGLQKRHPINPNRCIYRVSNRLRRINEVAYTPQAISIGPFHRGKKKLMATEALKVQFLKDYLCRISMEPEDAIKMAETWESEARNCYAEPIDMTSKEFVQMMLVDGCFMVEFMITNYFLDSSPPTDDKLSSSFYEAITVDLYRDLIMLENQLPFFVLECLYEKFGDVQGVSFVTVTNYFLNRWFMGRSSELPSSALSSKLNHLVDLLSFYYAMDQKDNDPVTTNIYRLMAPPTATELWEAGVKLRGAKEGEHILGISFHDGVLEIPHIEISDVFETSLRNLMAFEHYHSGSHKRYAIQYAIFMDGLINTEKDVRLLVKAKILTNSIGGSHKEISKLFNDLCKDITIAFDVYCFGKIIEALYEHCDVRCNNWIALLRRTHCNTPRTLISSIAGACLVLFLQTLFAVVLRSN